MNYVGVKKNPADNKKTDSSSIAVLEECYRGSTNSSGAKLRRQTHL